MPANKQKLVHNEVAKAAREWAGAWYEEACKDNSMYHGVMRRLFRNQADFINKCSAQFIPVARAALAKALANPNIPESAKEDIYGALLLDKTLPRPGHALDALFDGAPAARLH